MSISINTSIKIDSEEKLKEYVEYVKKFATMRKDSRFQKYIQNKCLETVRQISDERITGETTDNEYIQEYKSRHKIKETENGFILYNDTILPTSMLPVSPETAMNYPDGFSLALAFEYGVGIIGGNNPVVGAWAYNVNQHEKGWVFSKYDRFVFTRGYAGFEVYRYTAEEIRKKIKKWVLEYKPIDGGVSL